MEVIRYFLYKKRLFIYSLASLILGIVFVSFTGEIKELRLFFLFFTELFLSVLWMTVRTMKRMRRQVKCS